MTEVEQAVIPTRERTDEHFHCDEAMRWAAQIALLYEVAKSLTPEDRERFEAELRSGDGLAQAVASEIRRYKAGKWGTRLAHDEAVERLKEHAEWKRLWKPLPGNL